MRKVCLIKQPAGFGDILFCLKIANHIIETTPYKTVIWPVASVYNYLNEYIGTKDIIFCDETKNFPYKEIYNSNSINIQKTDSVLYIPLSTSDRVISQCLCHDNPWAHGHIKYNFCNVDYEDWDKYIHIRRNADREKSLLHHLGINGEESFSVINRNFGTPPNYRTRDDISSKSGLREIQMNFIQGYNLFDWMSVFEKASQIHTMDTSIYYILQFLGIDDVTIYSRYWEHPSDDFSYMKGHCNPKWKYVHRFNKPVYLNDNQ